MPVSAAKPHCMHLKPNLTPSPVPSTIYNSLVTGTATRILQPNNNLSRTKSCGGDTETYMPSMTMLFHPCHSITDVARTAQNKENDTEVIDCISTNS